MAACAENETGHSLLTILLLMKTTQTTGHLPRRNQTLLSVFGVEPRRIGGTEMFARELSQQLGETGWKSVLCFLSEPTGDVRRFMELPNVSFAALPISTNGDEEARANLKDLSQQFRQD